MLLTATLLFAAQVCLLGSSLSQNAVTPDETVHLPVGLRYWDTGEFWAYHHNPPLTRMVVALPPVIADVRRSHRDVSYRFSERWPDAVIARDFRSLHRHDYLRMFVMARWMNVGFALLGGCVVFCWARELWGAAGGLVALALWSLCPFVLAHSGLVTPDVGVTSLMVGATFSFWRYLRIPSARLAFSSGLLLGLAEAAKFTAVLLPPIWAALAVMRFATRKSLCGPRPSWWRLARDATLLTGVSLTTLNTAYLWEGTGKALGEFDLRSPSLTKQLPIAGGADGARIGNRFRDTWLGGIRVPVPEHYLLGFDDQLWDLEERGFYKYLRGELRGPDQAGWWYYYLYGLLVKWPLGTLGLLAMSLGLALARRFRREMFTELALLLPAIVIIGSLSMKSNLNSHVRYVLPALPFLVIFAGRCGAWCVAGRVWRPTLVMIFLAGNAISLLHVHPHYLAYFNEGAGGPRAAIRHLADSNVDWGQGLLALRDWLARNGRGETIHLAYFGGMEPRDVGINYVFLNPHDPQPGLQAVSATLLAGMPNPAKDGRGGNVSWGGDAFRRYRELEPVAVPGYSIYVFDLTEDDVRSLKGGRARDDDP